MVEGRIAEKARFPVFPDVESSTETFFTPPYTVCARFSPLYSAQTLDQFAGTYLLRLAILRPQQPRL